jgi:uncharacterized membrane protein
MKKNLLLGFLILFVLSTTAFAGISDPKKESDKPAVSRENKLSDEELSRMNRRAETDNLSKANLLNAEVKNSKNNLKASPQVIVESRRHGGYVYGGAGLLLLIILIIVLI